MSKTYNVVHTVKLVTEFNLDHPSTKSLINLPPEMLEQMCAETFVGLATKQGWLDKANENGTWAVVRFANEGE